MAKHDARGATIMRALRAPKDAASSAPDAELGELDLDLGGDPRAYRLVVYGTGGVGKTTLLAGMPDVYMLRAEDGSAHLRTRGTKGSKVPSWDELLLAIRRARHSRHAIGALVLDGFDAAERLCIAEIERRMGKSLDEINESSYGAGKDIVLAEMGRLFDALDAVREARAIPVGVTAHEAPMTIKNPEGRDYTTIGVLSRVKTVGPALCNWADHVWYLRRRVDAEVETFGDRMDRRRAPKVIARDGGLVIHLAGAATYYAKSRGAVALPATLPLLPPPAGWALAGRTLGLVIEHREALPGMLEARAAAALGDDGFPGDRREGAAAAFRGAIESRDWATADELCEAFEGEVAAAKRSGGMPDGCDDEDEDLDEPVSERSTHDGDKP